MSRGEQRGVEGTGLSSLCMAQCAWHREELHSDEGSVGSVGSAGDGRCGDGDRDARVVMG